jgi:hypothetical protein
MEMKLGEKRVAAPPNVSVVKTQSHTTIHSE